MLTQVSSPTADLHLTIEIGSDPICGSVGRHGDLPSRFSGWIELVAVIESARVAMGNRVGGQRLGSIPGVNGGES
jgi:hypothetical protein